MKPKTVMWAIIGAIALIVVGYFAFRPASPTGIRNVDAAGAAESIKAGAQIIDVRTAGEFQMGRIKGAVNVPVDQLEGAAQGWDREARYLIYCATGSRSVGAVQTMQALGFKNIDHLAAGIQAWTEPLETGQASTQQTVETAGLPVMIEFFTNS